MMEGGMKCKYCGAEIRFAKTAAGREMPVEKGNVPHWGKCPGADKARKPAAKHGARGQTRLDGQTAIEQ